MKINDPIIIKNRTINNRIVMPPMLCNNWGDNSGLETVDRAGHYGKRAKGGTGLIIVEATAVSPDSKIEETALGLWRDEHIPQFSKISKICHIFDSTVIIQLCHAGWLNCTDLKPWEIKEIKSNFIDAAKRAQEAGMDGIEIHGAHGFLLNQFTSIGVNKRDDEYGGSLENRIKLSLEIVEGIKKNTNKDFIISYRLGVNDLSFEEDIYFAKKLEEAGVDILDVSYGIGVDNLEKPESFKLSAITYIGTVFKKHLSIPVVAVNLILDPEDAKWLLSNELVDFVAVGRGLLADPDWTNKAIKGEPVNSCFYCKSWCKYGVDGRKCPRFVLDRKNNID